ncbi:MAG: ATP synthase subunit I [Desulfarculus sp.]|nr:ATP synthase subunit I [Desulfarculus sp.]
MKPLRLESAEDGMLRRLWRGNLVAFAVLTLAALLVAPPKSVVSLLVGGLIALVNFGLLERTVRRALLPRERSSALRKVLIKYYLRFIATALVLFFLMRQGWVEPLGLLVGLSVVMLSILAWGVGQARKLSKEAV